MKVCHPSEKLTSLKRQILQLQLTLELSQIQEILSAYSDLLFFFAEYSFLFINDSTETPVLNDKHSNFEGCFITQDSARDGGNWWGYCGNNPLCCIDSNRLEITAIATIKSIEKTKFGYTAKGDITFSDNDSGVSVTTEFFSGGIPYGNPIPIGSYDILQPTKEGHYRLEALDSVYGDDEVEGTNQGLLRLHEKGRGNTMGCVSIENDKAWSEIDSLLKNTETKETEVKSKSRNHFQKKLRNKKNMEQ